MKYCRSVSWGTLLLAAWLVLIGAYHVTKPLPAGVSVAWPVRHVMPDNVAFLADRTFVIEDEAAGRHFDQHIFDEIMSMIESAEHYVVTDMFLYNDWQGSVPEEHRQLAAEFTQGLLTKRAANPTIPITVITDPINEAYGGDTSEHLEQLQQADIEVIVTNLKPLRDSNPFFSAPWRTFVQWFGNTSRGGSLPHPFAAGGENVTARTWLALLNFKANHRKVIVADEATLVTSANPHDGSSAHSNVAIKIENQSVANDALDSEQAVARFSGADIPDTSQGVSSEQGNVAVQLLTEGTIRQHIIELINTAQSGDSIDMAMFYLAERSVIGALLQAAERGVNIRLILDPNKDAFGHTKNGVPNRPVAHELTTKSNYRIKLRWCDTHGEQCHTKLVLFKIGDQHHLTTGSANLTRRNISDYNLETNILVSANEEIPAITAARTYFEEIWENKNGRMYTTDYIAYADPSLLKTVLYRVQETTGLSSF